MKNNYNIALMQEKISIIGKNLSLPNKKQIMGILWAVVRFLFLLGLAFVIFKPIISSFSIALRDVQDIKDPSIIWIPKNFTFANIKAAIVEMKFSEALCNTFIISGISSLLQVVSCAIVGYGFARFNFKFKNIFFICVIMTLIIPPQTLYVPTYKLYLSMGLIDNVLSMYLPAFLGIGIRSGLFIYIFRQFYINLPKELEEAALIDGCGYYQTFIRIIIPSVRTAILTVFLFSIVWYYNDVYFANMYFDNTQTISRALSSFQSVLSTAYQGDPIMKSAILQAGSLLSILPMMILYIICHRFFVEGIERSGIVG